MIESESADGAEKENARPPSDGLVTDLRWLHVNLASANANEIGSVAASASGTVLGNENEIGIGHLGAVVGMAVRAVRAVEVVGTVEATATGHWPKDWDFEILSHGTLNTLGRTYTNSPLLGPANIVYPVRNPLSHDAHIVALADAFLFDSPIHGHVVCINFLVVRAAIKNVYISTPCACASFIFLYLITAPCIHHTLRPGCTGL